MKNDRRRIILKKIFHCFSHITGSTMNDLYQPATLQGILRRIESLNPQTPRLWGKMSVSQMLAHCSVGMEMATGKKKFPRAFIGRLFGSFIKSSFLADKPFRKNGPTGKEFVIADMRDFAVEQSRLSQLVQEFSEGGEKKCTSHPHSFFGDLTPKEWSILMYKHLDHHLQQFGA